MAGVPQEEHPCGVQRYPQSGTEPPVTQQEMALAPSLTQLSLDLICRRELTLGSGRTKLTPTLDRPHWVELILSTSPAELTQGPACQPELTLRSKLTKLTLDPAHPPELILSPRLAELTPGSACHQRWPSGLARLS